MPPIQGAQVQSLVRELDPHMAIKSSHATAELPRATMKTQYSQINKRIF